MSSRASWKAAPRLFGYSLAMADCRHEIIAGPAIMIETDHFICCPSCAIDAGARPAVAWNLTGHAAVDLRRPSPQPQIWSQAAAFPVTPATGRRLLLGDIPSVARKRHRH
jgi:hypothetical protein